MGVPWHLPPLNTIPSLRDNSVRPIHHLPGRSMGDPKKPRFHMAYLLLAPAQEVEEERRFGLVVLMVHPSQTLLLSLEEVVRKLNLLINTKEDWPYAFTWVCKDLLHILLSNAWHISIMVDSAPSRSTCEHLSHLEVHQFLQLCYVRQCALMCIFTLDIFICKVSSVM